MFTTFIVLYILSGDTKIPGIIRFSIRETFLLPIARTELSPEVPLYPLFLYSPQIVTTFLRELGPIIY